MKLVARKIVKYLLALLIICGSLTSCGTAHKVGQNDIDRINQNERQFNKDMKGFWE